MIPAAILLFSLAAAIGLALVVMGVRYHRSSLTLGLVHASAAVLALTFLGTYILREPINMLYNNAAVLFVLALSGGVILLALHDKHKPPPMIVVGIHAVMALAGLLLLVFGAVTGTASTTG
ncbi:hypothetical protein MNBD_GAMMA13-1118 [hydrothermal vent metagenome]|uniref:Uncharacterized protein n=1 Tax=hydrothermal vent metagenome TaxID=652676 RepID=A0A3B0ZN37_9ZZZZ